MTTANGSIPPWVGGVGSRLAEPPADALAAVPREVLRRFERCATDVIGLQEMFSEVHGLRRRYSRRRSGSLIALSHPDRTLEEGGVGGVLAPAETIPELRIQFPGVAFAPLERATEVLGAVLAPKKSGERAVRAAAQSAEQYQRDPHFPSHRPTVIMDIDGTLTEDEPFRHEAHFAPLREGAREGMWRLRNAGVKLCILTVRGNKKLIADWLRANDIPYDEINENSDQPSGTSQKLIGDVYVDNKAEDGRQSWDVLPDRILERVGLEHSKHARDRADLDQYGSDTRRGLVLTAAEVGDLLGEQHHNAERGKTPEALRSRWVVSPTFTLCRVPVRDLTPPVKVDDRPTHSTGPLVVELNVRGRGKDERGKTPATTIIDGKHRWRNLLKAGEEYALAYIGSMAQRYLPRAEPLGRRRYAAAHMPAGQQVAGTGGKVVTGGEFAPKAGTATGAGQGAAPSSPPTGQAGSSPPSLPPPPRPAPLEDALGGGGWHDYSHEELTAMGPAQRRSLAGLVGKVKVKGLTDNEVLQTLQQGSRRQPPVASPPVASPPPATSPPAASPPPAAKLPPEARQAALTGLLGAASRGEAIGGLDPRGDLAHLPAGDRLAAARERLLGALRGRILGVPVDALPRGDLSPEEFRAVLLHLHDSDAAKLSGWPRMADDLPRPDLAPVVSGKIMGFLQPPQPEPGRYERVKPGYYDCGGLPAYSTPAGVERVLVNREWQDVPLPEDAAPVSAAAFFEMLERTARDDELQTRQAQRAALEEAAKYARDWNEREPGQEAVRYARDRLDGSGAWLWRDDRRGWLSGDAHALEGYLFALDRGRGVRPTAEGEPERYASARVPAGYGPENPFEGKYTGGEFAPTGGVPGAGGGSSGAAPAPAPPPTGQANSPRAELPPLPKVQSMDEVLGGGVSSFLESLANVKDGTNIKRGMADVLEPRSGQDVAGTEEARGVHTWPPRDPGARTGVAPSGFLVNTDVAPPGEKLELQTGKPDTGIVNPGGTWGHLEGSDVLPGEGTTPAPATGKPRRDQQAITPEPLSSVRQGHMPSNREDAHRLLSEQPVVAHAPLASAGGTPGRNGSYLVSLGNEHTGLFKPEIGEDRLLTRAFGHEPGDQHKNEVAFASGAAAMGWGNLVPPTVSREVGDMGKGSLQWFVPGAKPAAEMPLGEQHGRSREELVRAATLDYIFGSQDRHGNNYLIGPTGGLHLIDNGFSGASDPSTAYQNANELFKESVRQGLPVPRVPDRMDDVTEAWQRAGKSPEAIAAMRSRYRAVQAAEGDYLGNLRSWKNPREYMSDQVGIVNYPTPE